MFKRKLFATAAVAAALSMPALAAEYGTKSQTGADAQTTIGGSAGPQEAGLNFGTAVSAMNNAKAAAGEIQSLSSVETVTIVDVSTLAQGQNEAAIENAMSRNEADLTELRSAIEANADVLTAIKAKDASFDVSTVVAADLAADGSLVIFTQG